MLPRNAWGAPISAELEHAILACLEKSRAKRPQTARDLAAMLDRVAQDWSLDDAEAWWSRHERGQHPAAGSTAATFKESARTVNESRPKPPAPANTAAPTAKTVAHGLDRTADFQLPDDADPQ